MNILDQIVLEKQNEISRLPAQPITEAQLLSAVSKSGKRDFVTALAKPHRGPLGLIAELKKASPSAGVISPDFDPLRIAREYEAAGADCLSVLTDKKFFQGSLQYLKAIREAVGLPLLRKDFIIDERQILESIEWGADAILLIVSILRQEELKHFHSLATKAGIAALVEVHNEVELERALTIGARLIGINNRDLKTFKVDLGTTERLAALVRRQHPSSDKIVVAESGLRSRADIIRIQAAGCNAVLIGESLMKSSNIASQIAELLGVRNL